MSADVFALLLDLAVGLALVCAYVAVWRRSLVAIIRALAVQGAAVAAVPLLLGLRGGHPEAVAAAALVVVLKAFLVPWILLRVVRRSAEPREIEPLINIPASLLAAGALTLLAYVAGQPMVAASPDPVARAVPAALAVTLLGFLLLVARRKAVTQLVGFLILENGIVLVAFLTTVGLPLVVELGAALDLLLAVLVLQVLTARIQAAFGSTDLNRLRELHD